MKIIGIVLLSVGVVLLAACDGFICSIYGARIAVRIVIIFGVSLLLL